MCLKLELLVERHSFDETCQRLSNPSSKKRNKNSSQTQTFIFLKKKTHFQSITVIFTISHGELSFCLYPQILGMFWDTLYFICLLVLFSSAMVCLCVMNQSLAGFVHSVPFYTLFHPYKLVRRFIYPTYTYLNFSCWYIRLLFSTLVFLEWIYVKWQN